MKIQENFLLREVAGTPVVMPVGDAAERFNGMIKLNDTATYLWRQMTENTTEEALLDAMMRDYEIDRDTALSDIRNFVNTLRAAGILDE